MAAAWRLQYTEGLTWEKEGRERERERVDERSGC
jgi:hypothetical protein